jgi:hypothetical protein
VSLGISAGAEELGRTLAIIGEEIEPALYLISQAARDEWRILQQRWRADGGGEEGASMSEEEIQALEAKVRRFRDIVRSLVPKAIGDETRSSMGEGPPRGDSPFATGV